MFQQEYGSTGLFIDWKRARNRPKKGLATLNASVQHVIHLAIHITRRAGSKQKAVIDFIEARFPALVEVAQEQVVQLNKPDELSRLTKQIAPAPDEATVRWVLGTFAT